MMTMPRRPDATDVPDPRCPKCWGSGFIDVPSDAVERVRNVDDRVADIIAIGFRSWSSVSASCGCATER
jgi:hypothetical protein